MGKKIKRFPLLSPFRLLLGMKNCSQKNETKTDTRSGKFEFEQLKFDKRRIK